MEGKASLALNRATVFCGSSLGKVPAFEKAIVDLGRELARQQLELVYGGGHVGLMGVLADAALASGVRVTGVIPQHLFEREVGHSGLSELIIVKSMHERKFKMAELGDIFIAAPGGFGTLDEFFEVLTWSQLGLHGKACALLNVEGYFDALIAWMDNAARSSFVPQSHRDMLIIDSEPASLLTRALAYRHSIQPKWSEAAELES